MSLPNRDLLFAIYAPARPAISGGIQPTGIYGPPKLLCGLMLARVVLPTHIRVKIDAILQITHHLLEEI